MKKFNPSKVYFILGFTISIVLVLIYYSKLNNWTLDYSFNSDILYFPSLYKDLFVTGNTLSGWRIPGAPGFFPDMLFYFILMAITGKVTLAALLFEIIQFVGIILLMVYLLKLCKPDINRNILMFVPLGLVMFVLPSITGSDYLLAFHILSNTYHLGPFVNTLIALILVIRFIKFKRLKHLIILLLLILIAIISDKLFLFMFSVPVVFVILISSNSKNIREHLKLVLYIVLASAFSLFAFRMLRFSGWFHIRSYDASSPSMQKIISSADVFVNQLAFYLNRNVFTSIVFILSFFSILVLLSSIIINFFKERKKIEIDTGWFIIAFSFVFIWVVMLIPILLGDYVGPAKIRYNISSFYMAILILPFALSTLIKLNNKLFRKLIPLPFLVLFTFIMFQSFQFKNFSEGLINYTTYYSGQAQAIDFANSKTKLKQGIATYWNAKPADLFNKSDLHIYTCLPSGYADYYIVGNEHWYNQSESDTNKVFNFVLLETKEDSSLVIKSLGKPINIINYKSFTVLIFNDFGFKPSRVPYYLHSNRQP